MILMDFSKKTQTEVADSSDFLRLRRCNNKPLIYFLNLCIFSLKTVFGSDICRETGREILKKNVLNLAGKLVINSRSKILFQNINSKSFRTVQIVHEKIRSKKQVN